MADSGTHDKQINVDAMDIDAVFDWLENEGITHQLHSLEEMKQLMRLNLKPTDSESSAGTDVSQSDVSESDLKEVLSKDQELRNQIGVLYDKIMRTFAKHTNWAALKSYLTTWCGCDILHKLEEHRNELQNKNCTIVIAGETSAGKSCFLNLLLGEEVLPSSLLCATATICVVHPIPHGEHPYFEIGGKRTKHVDRKPLIEKLKAILTSRSETDRFKQVDIYWQVPLVGLNKHINFVDTPGVGENEQMTAKVFEYLPNAAAFIYVLNSANAGGVQEDKLVEIFKKVEEIDQTSGLFSFEPTCTMFVCNKWDLVEERTKREQEIEQRVWEDTSSKLRNALPGLLWDKYEYMFKMSTTEALRYKNSGIGDTPKYTKLKKGLQDLVLHGLTSKSGMHYRWLCSFAQQAEIYISARSQHANATDKEKAQLYEHIVTKLQHIQNNKEIVRDRLKMSCNKLTSDMAKQLHCYLNSKEVQTRLKARVTGLIDKITAPDDDAFQYMAKKLILKIVVKEIDDWENCKGFWSDSVEKLTSEMKREIGSLLDNCRVVEAAIKIKDEMPEACENTRWKFVSLIERFSDRKKIVSTLSHLAISLLGFPLSMGLLERGINKMTKFLNREYFLQNLLKQVEKECLSEKSIHALITECYAVPMERRIHEQCETNIASRTNKCKSLIENIANDRRSAIDIVDECSDLTTNINSFTKQLKQIKQNNDIITVNPGEFDNQ